MRQSKEISTTGLTDSSFCFSIGYHCATLVGNCALVVSCPFLPGPIESFLLRCLEIIPLLGLTCRPVLIPIGMDGHLAVTLVYCSTDLCKWTCACLHSCKTAVEMFIPSLMTFSWDFDVCSNASWRAIKSFSWVLPVTDSEID